MSENNKYDRLEGSPPQLFFNQKEKDFVKQVNDELLERVIGQEIVYYPIDMETTNFHPLYGEAIKKNFLNPIKIGVLVEWTDNPTNVSNYGSDSTSSITIHFHKRRLTEDQNLFLRVGDFIAFDDNFYEILQTFEPKLLWGNAYNKFEISAKCVKARKGVFPVDYL